MARKKHISFGLVIEATRVTTNHEVSYTPMELKAIVISLLAQLEEVITCSWNMIAM